MDAAKARSHGTGRRIPGPKLARIILACTLAGSIQPAEGADLSGPGSSRIDNLFDAMDDTAERAGFYFGTRAKIGVTDDTRYPSTRGPVDVSYDPVLGSGAVIGVNSGPRFGPLGVRGEFELGYINAEVDEVSVRGVARSAESSVGSLTGYSGFASGYIDAHLSALAPVEGTPLQRVTPFIGGGIGVAHVGLSEQGTFSDDIIMDDWDTGLALHLSAGVRVNVTQRMTLELGYRREVVPDLTFEARDGSASKVDITNDLFTIGLQRSF